METRPKRAKLTIILERCALVVGVDVVSHMHTLHARVSLHRANSTVPPPPRFAPTPASQLQLRASSHLQNDRPPIARNPTVVTPRTRADVAAFSFPQIGGDARRRERRI